MINCIQNSTQVYSYKPGFFMSMIIPHLFRDQEISKDIEDIIKSENKQIDYLDRYLDTLGTKTLIMEGFYIDRHYMDEYQKYYATKFQSPVNHSIRIHVFRDKFTENDLYDCQQNPYKPRRNKQAREYRV